MVVTGQPEQVLSVVRNAIDAEFPDGQRKDLSSLPGYAVEFRTFFSGRNGIAVVIRPLVNGEAMEATATRLTFAYKYERGDGARNIRSLKEQIAKQVTQQGNNLSIASDSGGYRTFTEQGTECLRKLQDDPELTNIAAKISLHSPDAATLSMMGDETRPSSTERTAIAAWVRKRNQCINIAISDLPFLLGDAQTLFLETSSLGNKLIVDLFKGNLTFGEYTKKRSSIYVQAKQKETDVRTRVSRSQSDFLADKSAYDFTKMFAGASQSMRSNSVSTQAKLAVLLELAELREEDNSATVVATEPSLSNSPSEAKSSTSAGSKPARVDVQATGVKVFALVIGNSAYRGAALTNPRNDAQAIGKQLSGFGINVDVIFDATRKRFVEALTKFADKSVGADVILLYYAGHGVQYNGVNYLVPVDVDLTVDSSASAFTLEAISLNQVLEQYLPAKTRIVFLDACRDNPMSRSLARTRGGSATRGLAPVSVASGTLISYATKDGSVAMDGSGRNSPFAEALLAHLGDPSDINIVLRRVRSSVLKATGNKQEPWEYGSLVGDELVLSRMAKK